MANRAWIMALSLGALVATSRAQVIRVPRDQSTIAKALAAASAGTTILVAPGTYKETLVWPAVDGIRLVSEKGPASTVIDADKHGRVVSITTSVTRKTEIVGFTITGGLVTTDVSAGAGVWIVNRQQECSPTLRDNRVTRNAAGGKVWNLGAGMFVAGPLARPLISRSEVSFNINFGPGNNYGAGIAVSDRARPVVLANRIVKNSNVTGTDLFGAGIHCDGAGTLLASNFILDNTNQLGKRHFGGGVFIGPASASVVSHNTIAANMCDPNDPSSGGGGVYVFSMVVGSTLENNLIVNNRAGNSSGLMAFPFSLRSQYRNNYYGNTSNSIFASDYSLDPGFVSTTDYHIGPGSSGIDSAYASSTKIAIDIDGHPRNIDGDSDGLAGNGARRDVGADEWTPVDFHMTGVAKLGGSLTFNVHSRTPDVYAAFFGAGELDAVIEPFGTLLVPAPLVVASGMTPGKFTIPIPNSAQLANVDVAAQALVLSASKAGVGWFTNRLDWTIR